MKEQVNQIFKETKMIIAQKKWKDEVYPEINFIEVLRNITDEVNVHSQIIYSLLIPKNNLHKAFADLFFSSIGCADLQGKDYRVDKEYHNIDLLIRTDDQVIIIENKIYAEDQENQLFRYHEDMLKSYKKEQIKMVYLSLDGKAPSDYSLRTLKAEDIHLISYEQEILNWIEACILLSAEYPSYRENLIQYRNIIQRLIGRSESVSVNKVSELIKSSVDSIEAANLITEAFEKVKIEVQLDFWQSLEKELVETYKYSVLDFQKYSESWVGKFYRQSKNNKYYGLMFPIMTLDDQMICAFVEITSNIYWGFVVLKRQEGAYVRENQHDKKHKNLINDFDVTFKMGKSEFLSYNQLNTFKNNQWIGGFEYTDYRYNFRNFNSEQIISLIQAEFMQTTVKAFAKVINESVNIYKNNINR